MNDEFNWTPDELQAIVDEHALVLFMKGEPGAPQCGFSNRAAQALQAFGEPFADAGRGFLTPRHLFHPFSSLRPLGQYTPDP